MFLTDSQWEKVGNVIRANKGIREINITQDHLGNAKVTFYGRYGIATRKLRGNVVLFPVTETEQKNNGLLARVRVKVHKFAVAAGFVAEEEVETKAAVVKFQQR